MPEKRTLKKAAKDKRQGKAPSTQAGNFVKEEIDHVRKGKHGAASAKQAIAIGLSKARKSGVNIPDKGKKSTAKKATKKAAVKKSAAKKSTKKAATKKAAPKKATKKATKKR